MPFNADIVLGLLQTTPRPLRIKDIWLILSEGDYGLQPSRSGVDLALRTLEKRGKVVRERRYDQDGDEIASMWTLKR